MYMVSEESARNSEIPHTTRLFSVFPPRFPMIPGGSCLRDSAERRRRRSFFIGEAEEEEFFTT
jgi:hypothetical protein